MKITTIISSFVFCFVILSSCIVRNNPSPTNVSASGTGEVQFVDIQIPDSVKAGNSIPIKLFYDRNSCKSAVVLGVSKLTNTYTFTGTCSFYTNSNTNCGATYRDSAVASVATTQSGIYTINFNSGTYSKSVVVK